MDADRRHELKQNSLDNFLRTAPERFRQHGSKIMLVLIAIMLVIVLVRYRNASAREGKLRAGQNLSAAREAISGLRMLPAQAPAEVLLSRRNEFAADARRSYERVFDDTDDRTLVAEAYVARGDLMLALLNLPELPGATTRPVQGANTSSEQITQAERSYREVVSNFSDITPSVTTARFGLASLAEHQGKFDEARKQYDALVASSQTPGVLKQLAQARLANLDNIAAPVLLADASTQPAADLTAPPVAPDGPTLPALPTTLPSTLPAMLSNPPLPSPEMPATAPDAVSSIPATLPSSNPAPASAPTTSP